MIAGWQLLPDRLVGAFWLVLAIALALAGRRRSGLAPVGLAVAGAATLWTAAMVPDLWTALAGASLGLPVLATELPGAAAALQALALPALLLLVLWRPAPGRAAAAAARRGMPVARRRGLCPVQAGLRPVERSGFRRPRLCRAAGDHPGFVRGGLAGLRPAAPVPGLDSAQARRIGITLTALAAARLVWFDMLTDNPLLDPPVGRFLFRPSTCCFRPICSEPSGSIAPGAAPTARPAPPCGWCSPSLPRSSA